MRHPPHALDALPDDLVPVGDPDWEHRDALLATGWTPVEWRCKHCLRTGENELVVEHVEGCIMATDEMLRKTFRRGR